MKLLALDGNSILNRAFYGIKLLTTKDGTKFTNGIYGFFGRKTAGTAPVRILFHWSPGVGI